MRLRLWVAAAVVTVFGSALAAVLFMMDRSEGSMESADDGQVETVEDAADPPTGVSWAAERLATSVEQFGSVSLEVSVTLDRPLANAVLGIDGDVAELMGAERVPLGEMEAGDQTVGIVVSAPADAQPGRFEGALRLVDGETPLDLPVAVSVTVTELDAQRAESELLIPAADRISRSPDGVVFVHDQLTVVLEGSLADVHDIADEIGARLVGSAPLTRTVQLLLERPASLDDLLDLAEEVEQDPRVAVALPSVSSGISDVRYPTNDPVWPEPSWGASQPGYTWHMEQARAPQAWTTWTGREPDAVVPNVAIIDVDFEIPHEDLSFAAVAEQKRVWAANGHGNHVAGIACADGNNGVGVTGVSWRCDLQGFNVGVNFYDPEQENDDGSRGGLDYGIWTESVAEAMAQAAQAGVRVANLSIAFPAGPPEEAADRCAELKREGSALQRTARGMHLQYAVATSTADQIAAELGNEPVLWIAAAGNDACASTLYQPAGMTAPLLVPSTADTWVTVAATDRTGGLSNFSNYPASATLAAPGGSTVALDLQLAPGQRGGQHIISAGACSMGQSTDCAYTQKSGTSMAAPMVTGTVALMLIANPDLTTAQAKQCLTASTEDRGILHPYEDRLLASGLLDTHAAVRCAEALAMELLPSDLLTAPVPSLCDHPAGFLENGSLPGIPGGEGEVTLSVGPDALRDGDISSPFIAKGDVSADGRDEIAITVFCNRGGVRWPDSVLVYGPGPELLGVFEPWEHVDDRNNRGSVGTVEYLEDQGAIRVRWLTHREGDFSSAGSLPASAILRLDQGGIFVDSVETFDELPLVRQVFAAAEAGDRDTLMDLMPEAQIDLLMLMGGEGWDGEPNCFGMTEWPSPWQTLRVCSASIYDGASAVFLGLDLVGGEWKVVEVASAG